MDTAASCSNSGHVFASGGGTSASITRTQPLEVGDPLLGDVGRPDVAASHEGCTAQEANGEARQPRLGTPAVR